eukprot:gene6080-7576_t
MNNLLKGYQFTKSLAKSLFINSNVATSYIPSYIGNESDQDQRYSYSKSRFAPLNQPHPGLKHLEEQFKNLNNSNHPNPEMEFQTEMTTLPNGIRVISKQTHEPACAIGVYIKAGSAYETKENRGAFNLIEKMTFKETKSQSTSDLVKSLEDISANATSSSSRDVMNITIEVLRKDVDYVLKVFSEQIKEPVYSEEEFKSQVEVCIRNWEMMNSSVDTILPELLHAVAYGEDCGFGPSVVAEPDNFAALTPQHLFDALKQHYVGKNIVVSATGVEHRELTDMVSRYFGDIPYITNVKSKTFDSVPYYGGTKVLHSEQPGTDSSWIIGFPFKGFSSIGDSTNEIFTAFVLQSLLGGGSSFSTGGPGKGMQSRLNLNVVYRLPEVKHCSSFYALYSKTSLFGVHLVTEEGYLGRGLQLVVSELVNVLDSLTEEEIQRAKNQQKTSIMGNLELRSVVCDDMAKQLITSDKYTSPEEICKAIDAVTIDDIKKVFLKIFLSQPSVVSLYYENPKVSNDFTLSAEEFSTIMKSILLKQNGHHHGHGHGHNCC